MSEHKGKLEVTLPGTGKNAKPMVHVVQTTIQDRLAFEQARRKNKGWGKLEDNALRMLPFTAWSAMSRQGLTSLTWMQFSEGDTAAIDVSPYEPAEDDDDDDLEVDGLGKDTLKEA